MLLGKSYSRKTGKKGRSFNFYNFFLHISNYLMKFFLNQSPKKKTVFGETIQLPDGVVCIRVPTKKRFHNSIMYMKLTSKIVLK